MLTPKCPARDFRVSARENATKNRLYRFKWNLRGRGEAGIRGKFDGLGKDRKLFYINDLMWLSGPDSNLDTQREFRLPTVCGQCDPVRQVAIVP
jgi:hypothetical protein